MASLEMENLTAIYDTREGDGHVWNLAPMQMAKGKLCTADYSVKGLEDLVRVERKSLPDFLMCVGRERERFDREMIRLRGFKYRAVVVECTWEEILAGHWRSKIHPNAVRMSAMSWERRGVPIHFLGKPDFCATWVREFLFSVARDIHKGREKFCKAMGV